MQNDSTSSQIFSGEQGKIGKALDLLFVIAGWPIVYSIHGTSYTLAGDLAGFSSIQPWANLPKIAGGKVKGRPEEGGFTIGQMDIEILDRAIGATGAGLGGHAVGQRYGITDLISRQAYLQGNVAGVTTHTTTLGADISPSYTGSVPLASTSGLAASGVLYIGQECLHYSSVIDGTHVNVDARGYRLTQPTRHLGSGSPVPSFSKIFKPPFGPLAAGTNPGVNVYDFLPTLLRRQAFIYKGFQSMTSTSQFLPAFGGQIVSQQKKGPLVTFTVTGTNWELYLNGQERLADVHTSTGNAMAVTAGDGNPFGGSSGFTVPEVGNWNTSFATHYMLRTGTVWCGVTAPAVVMQP